MSQLYDFTGFFALRMFFRLKVANPSGRLLAPPIPGGGGGAIGLEEGRGGGGGGTKLGGGGGGTDTTGAGRSLMSIFFSFNRSSSCSQ